MLECFFGAEGHVRAAEHDLDPGCAELIRQRVSGRLGGSGGRDADEVGGQALIEVDGGEHVAENRGVVAEVGEHGGHQRQAEAW
jgi:hypothetical protein